MQRPILPIFLIAAAFAACSGESTIQTPTDQTGAGTTLPPGGTTQPGATPTPTGTPAEGTGGCQTDFDCKADRVCENHVCVAIHEGGEGIGGAQPFPEDGGPNPAPADAGEGMEGAPAADGGPAENPDGGPAEPDDAGVPIEGIEGTEGAEGDAPDAGNPTEGLEGTIFPGDPVYNEYPVRCHEMVACILDCADDAACEAGCRADATGAIVTPTCQECLADLDECTTAAGCGLVSGVDDSDNCMSHYCLGEYYSCYAQNVIPNGKPCDGLTACIQACGADAVCANACVTKQPTSCAVCLNGMNKCLYDFGCSSPGDPSIDQSCLIENCYQFALTCLQ